MYSVAICDDDEVLAFRIERVVKEYEKKCGVEFTTEIFFTGEELLNHISAGEYYDFIFLDIELKKLSGIEVGLKIRNELKNNHIQIIYISCNQTYALELFQIRPTNFLIKPIHEDSISTNIHTCIELMKKQADTFEYRINRDIYKEGLDNIIYFSSQNREVNLHLDNGVKCFYGTLNSIEEDLADKNFFRIHRSFLVNMNKVKSYTNKNIILTNGDYLPIGRGKLCELKGKLI